MLSFFWKVAGADPRILSIVSRPKEQNYFALLGAMILCLSFITWISIDFALMLTVEDKYGLARIGIVFFGAAAFVVYLNFYRFVFAVTPGEGEGAHDLTDKFAYNSGLVLRFLCIGMLGFIVAKAYELILYNHSIEPLIELFNRGDIPELRHRTRLYLGFSISEIEYIKTGGLLARIKLIHALLGWKIWFSTLPTTLLFLIPLILKTFSTTVQDGEYQKLKVLEQNLLIENARLLTIQHVKGLNKKNIGTAFEPFNI
jgi:hypothetical protein